MLNAYPSTATKAQLLDLIFEELGRAGYQFDRDPAEDVSALRKVDALMASWQAQGIMLNYNFPATFGMGRPTDKLGVPDAAVDTIAAWAAMRVAPGIGKSMSAESRKAMADGLAFLRAETATIPAMKLPRNTPLGMGNKPWTIWQPFEECEWSDAITLVDLTLINPNAPAGNGYATEVIGCPQGAQMALINDVSGKYTLLGSILSGAGLVAGTDAPVIRQIMPNATNSFHDTTLSVIVT